MFQSDFEVGLHPDFRANFQRFIFQWLSPIDDAGLQALCIHGDAQPAVGEHFADFHDGAAFCKAQIADYGECLVDLDLRSNFEVLVLQSGVHVSDVFLIAYRDAHHIVGFLFWLLCLVEPGAWSGLFFGGGGPAQIDSDAVGRRGQFGVGLLELGDHFFRLFHHGLVGFQLLPQGQHVAEADVVARGHADDLIQQPEGAQLHVPGFRVAGSVVGGDIGFIAVLEGVGAFPVSIASHQAAPYCPDRSCPSQKHTGGGTVCSAGSLTQKYIIIYAACIG
ncbi:MAG: hypothetical protein RMJ43_13505 [Chloroherpetonaceae bacterium]|nr:hypothetical protein [Chloroherpetonaceae bacterium]